MDNIFSTYRSVDPVPQFIDNTEEPLPNYNPLQENPLFGLLNNIDRKISKSKKDQKQDITDWFSNYSIIKDNSNKNTNTRSMNYTGVKGFENFNKAYDNVEKKNPEAKNYRKFLTDMAYKESGFNSAIQNRAGAPAYGYFQFMQDGNKWNNITHYAGVDIDTFRSNPELQIEAAIKLAKDFEKGFSQEDINKASSMGYSKWALLGGAWLAGNGGVKRFLAGKGNPSDRKWSKSGAGTSVKARMDEFNY